MQKLAETLLYLIVLLAGLAGLAITTCGGFFIIQNYALSIIGPFVILSFGLGLMIIFGVIKFLTRKKSEDS